MDPGSSADQFLIEQIRAGSERAWRQLIDRFAGRLGSSIAHTLGTNYLGLTLGVK